MEDRCKVLELEKESILNNNSAEITNLRSAHSKALETLMGYQEENDVLRSAVVELSSKTSTQSSRNNSLLPSNPNTATNATNAVTREEVAVPESSSSAAAASPDSPSEPQQTMTPPTSLAQKRQPIKSTTNYI